MNVGDAALVAAATFAAGAINAVAGGGSLVSFPALLATGMSSLSANVTNTIAIWPGYGSSAATLRRDIGETRRQLRPFAIAAGLGAVAGAVLLLIADDDVFDAVVPFLVLAAAALLALPKTWIESLRRTRAGRPRSRAALAGVFVAGVYGAYFGGGLGIILLAVLNACLVADLREHNAMKTVLQLIVNTIALGVFVFFAPVEWQYVALGAPAALAGGFAGARLSVRINPEVLRLLVVALSVGVGITLLVT